MGDELLVAVAGRLSRVVRPQDMVARIGGDEFVVLAQGVTTVAIAREVADRIRLAIGDPVSVAGRMVTVDCSIGITLADGSRPDVLLQQADTALYRAKDRGRGRSVVYDQAMQEHAQRRVDTEGTLRTALKVDGVVVHYQPIVALPDRTLVGTEALVRLRDGETGLIGPDRFISVAEDSGLILPLGANILRQACEQQAVWTAQGQPAPLRVSVNVAAGQLLSDGIVETIVSTLAAADLPTSALCLELTERR